MASLPLTLVAAAGRKCSVEFVVRESGTCPAREFWEACEQIREGSKLKPDSTARAKFAVLFQEMADNGALSPKRFKKEMGKLFAFAQEVRNVQIRFPCFQDGSKWIVTSGFQKPGAQSGKGQWPDSEVKKAEDMMAEYFRRKQAASSKTGASQ